MRHTLSLVGLALLVAAGPLSAQRQNYPSRLNSMSGTYELESTRGDNPERAADMATRGLPAQQRDRAYRNLLTRLEPPTTLSLDSDRSGRSVTISSTNGPRASFDADGRVRREVAPNGREITTRAQFQGERLSVQTTGNRNTDYLVTFEPLNAGNGLLVTRRMDSDDLRRPVTVRSYYRRVAYAPRWNTADRGDDRDRGSGRWRQDDLLIPDGTRIVGVLDTGLSTRSSRAGERFSMTVQSPRQYEGARIEGTVGQVGQDRKDMQLNFETIRLRNGQSADFEGRLDSVRTPDGKSLKVDDGLPEESKTGKTVQGGAIGAALGAIIGAVAGGGKGAAIGAVVGGAGGAIVGQSGSSSVDLSPGTELTLVASPRRSLTQ